MKVRKSWALIIPLLLTATVLSPQASQASSSDKVLRIAFGSNGTDGKKIWDAAAAQFQKDNPGWKVDFEIQNDDLYETIGLQNLLTSQTAPDVYFEWAGQRLQNKLKDGYAADITSLVQSAGLNSEFSAKSFASTTIGGKIYMVPFTSDVTNVIWYNKDIFAKYSLSVPKTWDQLMALSAKLKSAGITPFAVGNKDLWVAGNWNGHLLSRIVGEKSYDQTLSTKSPLNSPAWVKAMGYWSALAKAGYVNKSANSISDNQGYSLFFTGKYGMLPIGSWIVAIQQQQSPNFHMSWFNLPAVTGGAGNQNSVMGVTTGYIVNAKSQKQAKAIEFLKDAFTPTEVAAWEKAGFTPVAKASATSKLDPLSQQMVDLLQSGATLVAPPDTGYTLKVANALNTATAQVLDGFKSPQAALDQAESAVQAK